MQPFHDTIVIGAGLTGLTTAHTLRKRGVDCIVLEQEKRVGGQIHTFQDGGFVFESGPNTGVISYPEVAELFDELQPYGCQIETAHEASKQRWVWKKGRFHALPCGPKSAFSTSLFTWTDKLRILGEPFRKPGTDPDESVAELVVRRLGRSYLDYAVDPFISGVYAGDPFKLVTRHALPKLYNLEHDHGSFIRGAIAKYKAPKTDRDRRATKQVFSAKGGLGRLIEALERSVGSDRIVLEATHITVQPTADGRWEVGYRTPENATLTVQCNHVVTTVGAYALPSLLPFVDKRQMEAIASLHYAPIVQVSVGVNHTGGVRQRAFGGLIPSCERQQVLGILFPSSCFDGRSPQDGALYSFFLGGMRRPEMLSMSDDALQACVSEAMNRMLSLPEGTKPDLIRIFRHPRAIPQYERTSTERFAAIAAIERQYHGLTLGGNICGGIGMADRIRQAVDMGNKI